MTLTTFTNELNLIQDIFDKHNNWVNENYKPNQTDEEYDEAIKLSYIDLFQAMLDTAKAVELVQMTLGKDKKEFLEYFGSKINEHTDFVNKTMEENDMLQGLTPKMSLYFSSMFYDDLLETVGQIIEEMKGNK